MSRNTTLAAAALMAAIPAACSFAASAITPLHAFTYLDGCSPEAPPVLVTDAGHKKKMLYGTNYSCGSANEGTLYTIDPSGKDFAVVHAFYGPDGGAPYGGLILGADGLLYGTTAVGGNAGQGTIFSLDPATGVLTTLHGFSGPDGSGIFAGLVADRTGVLYGTASGGGQNNAGTVFRFEPASGTYATLASFDGADGAGPLYGLAVGKDGDLYGTTPFGGANDTGVIYKVSAGTGKLTLLYSFGAQNGRSPYAGLVADKTGVLYGTTYDGGPNRDGTLFRFDPRTHILTTVYVFSGGVYNQGTLLLRPDGKLIGSSGDCGNAGAGCIFSVNKTTGALTDIADFDVKNGVWAPLSNGGGEVLFGASGGFANGLGGVFRVGH